MAHGEVQGIPTGVAPAAGGEAANASQCSPCDARPSHPSGGRDHAGATWQSGGEDTAAAPTTRVAAGPDADAPFGAEGVCDAPQN